MCRSKPRRDLIFRLRSFQGIDHSFFRTSSLPDMPPGRIPACAPCDIKTPRPGFRTATRFQPASTQINSRCEPCCSPTSAAANQRPQNHAALKTTGPSRPGRLRLWQAKPARPFSHVMGHVPDRNTGDIGTCARSHRNAGGNPHPQFPACSPPCQPAGRHSRHAARRPRLCCHSRSKAATCPEACTPVSVRPANTTERPDHPRTHRAFSSSPCTVLRFACR